MNDLAIKWTDALRSGKYAQAKQRLRTFDGYCCMGVLCNLVSNKWNQDTDKFFWPGIDNGYYLGMPPEYVLREVGLDDDQARELVTMNDTGSSFEEIANKIEELLGTNDQ